MNAGTLIEKRNAALARTQELIATAKAANRKLTTEEDVRFANDLKEAAVLNAALSGNSLPVKQNRLSALLPLARAVSALLGGKSVEGVERTPDGGLWTPKISNDISESSDGTSLIPLPAIERTEAVVSLPSLRRAGATYLGGDIPFGDPVYSRGVAFVTPGSAPSTYSEGSGPSASNDPTIYPDRVTPAYYADLQKISIQFYQDLPTISQAGLLQAMLNNLLYSIDAGFISTLLSDTPSVNPPSSYSDLYEAALNAIAAIHSYFMDGSAVWVGGRQARRAFLNVRDMYGRPIFQPASTPGETESLLGYPWIMSEAAGASAIFGNFRAGVTAVSTGTWLQVLKELYAESNEFGLKVHCRAGMKCYGSVIGSGKPQPLCVINTNEASS